MEIPKEVNRIFDETFNNRQRTNEINNEDVEAFRDWIHNIFKSSENLFWSKRRIKIISSWDYTKSPEYPWFLIFDENLTEKSKDKYIESKTIPKKYHISILFDREAEKVYLALTYSGEPFKSIDLTDASEDYQNDGNDYHMRERILDLSIHDEFFEANGFDMVDRQPSSMLNYHMPDNIKDKDRYSILLYTEYTRSPNQDNKYKISNLFRLYERFVESSVFEEIEEWMKYNSNSPNTGAEEIEEKVEYNIDSPNPGAEEFANELPNYHLRGKKPGGWIYTLNNPTSNSTDSGDGPTISDIVTNDPDSNGEPDDPLVSNGTPIVEPDDGLPEPDTKPSDANRILSELSRSNQVIFYGPPGTGKTWTAIQFVRWWLHEEAKVDPKQSRTEFVTFHPSYTYEEFVEGVTITSNEDGHSYEVKDGALMKIVRRAMDDYESTDYESIQNPYVLIIDEVNRGDIPQILGELITTLDQDKRYNEPNQINPKLAHSRNHFTLPPNLYILGTMNTADQSTSFIDSAIRRRFSFIPFSPDFSEVRSHYGFDLSPTDDLSQISPDSTKHEGLDAQLIELSTRALQEINRSILNNQELNKGKQIGHSILLGHTDTEDIIAAWKYKIFPLLEEFYFGEVTRMLEDIIGDTDIGIVNHQTKTIGNFESEDLVKALKKITNEEIQRDYADFGNGGGTL